MHAQALGIKGCPFSPEAQMDQDEQNRGLKSHKVYHIDLNKQIKSEADLHILLNTCMRTHTCVCLSMGDGERERAN